jgi:hypothetical protein
MPDDTQTQVPPPVDPAVEAAALSGVSTAVAADVSGETPAIVPAAEAPAPEAMPSTTVAEPPAETAALGEVEQAPETQELPPIDGDLPPPPPEEMAEHDMEDEVGPPIHHAGWDAIKSWVRREIHLSQTGGDEVHRRKVNP